MRREAAFALLAIGGSAHAGSLLINELTPNPPGSEAATSFFELKGDPNASLDGVFLLFIDADPGVTGALNEIVSLSGTLDSNGLYSQLFNFENPSFTAVLADTNLGGATTGITASSFTGDTVFDAVGVADRASDEANLFASDLGGTDLGYASGLFGLSGNSGEPELIFRDSVTDEWFQAMTQATGGELLVIADADGQIVNNVTSSFGNLVPTVQNLTFTPANTPAGAVLGTTPGVVNPTAVLIPAPQAAGLAGLGLIGLLLRRRRYEST